MPARVLTFFSFAVFSLTLLPRLMSQGMFLDGVHFASVARNLAEGVGTFWAPYYTATLYPVEHEHPPLGFWLQSLAFRLCGDSAYVEAFYGYVVGLVTLGLLTVLWNQVRRTEPDSAHAWFVLLLFPLTPVISRSLANNLLEPVMTVFVLAAAILSYAALRADTWWLTGVLSTGAGALTLAGMLVKGPAGAFVMFLPLLALATCRWVSPRNAALTQLGILCGMLVVACLVILPSEGARLFIRDHVRTQIVPSLAGLREPGSRLRVLGALLSELGIPVLVCAVGSVLLRIRPNFAGKEGLSFFLLLGLAGSLPFLLSPKQARRYVIPSFPFFLVALSVLFNQLALRIEQHVQVVRALRYGIMALSIALLVGAVTALVAGKGVISKAGAFHTDFSHTPLTLEPRTLVQVCPPALMTQWGLHANFQRKFKVSLTTQPQQKYYLTSREFACAVPTSCTEPLNEHPRFYALYRCQGLQ